MGVTNLWQILSPVQTHKSLSSLKGQTLAVDLSIWVCENACVKQMQGVVTRPYLRNLYFRINCLLQLGINLIFAVEGEAPDLKHETMSRRQEVQYKGKKKGPPKHKKQGRSHFNAKLRECCEMLDYLGVPYIHSSGEAEALCGLLNAAGVVDGCITNDGDVFLYGARTVYRNFTINSKDPHVETYSMNDIEDKLDLDREKMVALALLVGCDYVPKGVPGVGIEKATKLLANYKDISPLQRFKRWRTMTDSECFDSIEVQIKRKSTTVPEFPQKKIIDEFLIPRDPLPSRKFSWKRPKLVPLQTFSLTKLEWPEEYTQDKVLPLITLWDMTDIIKEGKHKHLIPYRIVKARVRHGIPSLEIEWYKQDDDRICQTEYYVTIEERNLFTQCFRQLVQEFDDMAAMKKSKSKGRKKKEKDTTEDITNIVTEENQDVDILTDQLDSLNLKPIITGQITDTKHPVVLVERSDPTEMEDSSIATGETNDMKNDTLNDYKHLSFNDTNEFDVSCAEENLSLRSRLLRKGSSNCSSQATCTQTDIPVLNEDSDSESDFPLYSEIKVKNTDTNHNILTLSPYNKVHPKEDISLSPNKKCEHLNHGKDKLRHCRFDQDKITHCNLDHDKLTHRNLDHDKLTHRNLNHDKLTQHILQTSKGGSNIQTEDSSVKIYNVSEFSHAGKIDTNFNTPNKSRMTALSPSLYQTLLESTPTSNSKLRKAALLNSILRSPLNVDSILNIVSRKGHHYSPIPDVSDLKSIDESLNNLSHLSVNAFGNFEIDSSLLKSIIASGGIVATSPDLEKINEESKGMQNIEKVTELEVNSDITTTKTELNSDVTIIDSLASKLSFDVNSPVVALQGKCSGQQYDNSPFYTSKIGNMEKEGIVIDLTCDSPIQDNCKQSTVNIHDDSPKLIHQVPSRKAFTCDTPAHEAEGKSPCSESEEKSIPNFKTPYSNMEVRDKSMSLNTPHFDCKTTLDLSCNDNTEKKRSCVIQEELLQVISELNFVNNCPYPGTDVYKVPCDSINKEKYHELKSGTSKHDVNLKETCTNELIKSSMDTLSPFIDKSCSFDRGCDMFSWTEEKENETIISASQSMMGSNITYKNSVISAPRNVVRGKMTSEKKTNQTTVTASQDRMEIDMISDKNKHSASQDFHRKNRNLENVSASGGVHLTSSLDVTVDDKSPVSLADRLRRKLNVSNMKGILQEVTGNK